MGYYVPPDLVPDLARTRCTAAGREVGKEVVSMGREKCDEFSPNITLTELASPAMAERISAV